MKEDKSQKRTAGKLKEKGQYLIALGIVGSMLLVAEFPIVVIFFFAIFAYFLFRIITSGPRNETRGIFEFYLSAHEMLRDDGRNWYGFELKEVINSGERILAGMTAAPPLVYFALGALYKRSGDSQSAIKYLSKVVEDEKISEAAYAYATPELSAYVKVLRKIERDPSEAPMTSAAICSLERTRKLRGATLLAESRAAYSDQALEENNATSLKAISSNISAETGAINAATPLAAAFVNGASTNPAKHASAERKSISEVLHDIYDKNIQ